MYWGKKKLPRFPWGSSHIVRLPIGIKIKNSLHFLQCFLHYYVLRLKYHRSPLGLRQRTFLHRISVTLHFRLCKLFASNWHNCQENNSNFFLFLYNLNTNLTFRSPNFGPMRLKLKMLNDASVASACPYVRTCWNVEEPETANT